MSEITSFCDRIAQYLIDPYHHHHSESKKKLAFLATIIIGILTLGMAQVASVIWRKCRHIKEKNETHELIGELFKKKLNNNKKENHSSIENIDEIQQHRNVHKHQNNKNNKLSDLEPFYDKTMFEQATKINAHLKENFKNQNKLICHDDNGNEFYAWYDSDSELAVIENQSTSEKLGIKVNIHANEPQFFINGNADHSRKIKNFAICLQNIYNQTIEKLNEPPQQVSADKDKGEVERNKKPKEDDPEFSINVQIKNISYHFSKDDILVIASNIQNGFTTFTVSKKVSKIKNNDSYVIWFNKEESAICIQERKSYDAITEGKNPFVFMNQNMLQIFINEEGKVNAFSQNGDVSSKNPKNLEGKFFDALDGFLKTIYNNKSTFGYSEHYNPDSTPIQIKIIRNGIKKIPSFHLAKLVDHIEFGFQFENDPKIMIGFLKYVDYKLEVAFGQDAGGLTRDYLYEIFEGLLEEGLLTFKTMSETSLVLPQTKKKCEGGKPNPTLSKKEKNLYHNIGFIFQYCYFSQHIHHPSYSGVNRTFWIGLHFDDALFRAALCLDTAEIDTPFEKISLATKLKMCRALCQSSEKQQYLKLITYYEKFDLFSGKELEKMIDELFLLGRLPMVWTIEEKEENPDYKKATEDKGKLKSFLLDLIFTEEGEHGQLGAQLAPIHEIAVGMKRVCFLRKKDQNAGNREWNNTISKVKCSSFSTKVQGSINRKEIVDRIILDCNNDQVRKKVNWLKEWILDDKKGATDEQLKNFLKFTTGSTSIAKDQTVKIKVKSQIEEFLPLPRVRTCSFEMQISPENATYGNDVNDFNKENFIKAIEIALRNPNEYQIM